METENKQTNKIAIITMFGLFGMISFVTNMAAPFGNIWGFKYEWAGMMGNLMNFAAYLFMGIPAGKMLVKYGYKKTALIAICVGILGLCVQYISSKVDPEVIAYTNGQEAVGVNFIVYLLGAFICGFCVCMLNTVVNPMLNLIGGGGNKGNQLVQAGATLNSLMGTLTPFLVGALIGTVTDKTSMTDVTPLLIAAICIFVAALVVISQVSIVEPQGDLNKQTFEHSPLSFRHCVLGVIAIFFYVGVEIGIPGELNFYITKFQVVEGQVQNGAAALAGSIAALYWLLMLCGRFLSTLISEWVSTKKQMTFSTTAAIILILIGIFLPESLTVTISDVVIPIKCFPIALCGLCTSVMWGGIFNLATEGLGKYTPAASGLFMTMVVGGGIMPLIQDRIAQGAGYIASYWLVIALLAYILFYSLVGCKNVNTDIKVD